MSLALPAAWAQAAGLAAIGYGLRTSAICNDKDVKVHGSTSRTSRACVAKAALYDLICRLLLFLGPMYWVQP